MSPHRPTLPLAAALGLRYLRSTRKDAFISFLSIAAAAGLALGTFVLVLALAAFTGFQDTLRAEILERTPQIEIELAAGADAVEARRTVAALPGVVDAQLLLRGRGWVMREGRVRPVSLVGFEGELPAAFPDAARREPAVYVGDRLARVWQLEPGDVLELVSSRPTLTPLGPQPRVRRLPLGGTFDTGRTELEDRVALPLAEAAALLGERRYRIEVDAGGLQPALGVAGGLSASLPAGSAVRTWRDLNRGLFFALRLEKSLMFVSVLLIVVVAALALVSDLTLIIASKRRDVGILGAMGAPPSTAVGAFLFLGQLLATGGVAVGATTGLATAWLLDRYELVRLPSGVYFLDHVPFIVRGGDLALILGVSLALAGGCALYAARKAALLDPVEALRR